MTCCREGCEREGAPACPAHLEALSPGVAVELVAAWEAVTRVHDLHDPTRRPPVRQIRFDARRWSLAFATAAGEWDHSPELQSGTGSGMVRLGIQPPTTEEST